MDHVLAGQVGHDEFGGKGQGDRAAVAGARSDERRGEAGDERIRLDQHPEVLLLGQPAGGRGGVGDGLAIQGAGVVHHGDVPGHDGAVHVVVLHLLLAEDVHRPLGVAIGRLGHRALSRESLVVRKREVGGVLQRRGERERHAAAEGQLLDVQGRHHPQLLLLGRRGVAVVEELLADFLVDASRVGLHHQVLRRLSGPEARDLGLLLELGGDGVEGGIDHLDRHLDAEELLALTQVLCGNVHDFRR